MAPGVLAPLIWIHSEDPYNPSDFSEMIRNSVPQIDYKPINTGPSALTLDNLNELNALGGREIFLTSREGIQAIPTWFKGVRPNKERRTENAVCSVIVVTDHGQGNVDAFYFYFYTYVVSIGRVLREDIDVATQVQPGQHSAWT
jgi:hypothetical protein